MKYKFDFKSIIVEAEDETDAELKMFEELQYNLQYDIRQEEGGITNTP